MLMWNGKPITGLKAIFVGPLMGIFMALIFTAIIGSITAFGLWLYSMFRPMEIEYEIFEESGDDDS